MLENLRRSRHRIARATLAAFALFWTLTAMTPCVMAASCTDPDMNMSAHCAHSGGKTAVKHACHPAAKADCQNIDQSRLNQSAPTDIASLHTPVLLLTLAPPATHTPGLQCAIQHQHNADAVPHPPLNLKHAILLI
jgi:hypothetical protein